MYMQTFSSLPLFTWKQALQNNPVPVFILYDNVLDAFGGNLQPYRNKYNIEWD